MKSQTVTVTATVSVESVHVHGVSRDASVKKLTARILHAPIMVFVLKASASARKAGLVRTVQLKIKRPFLVSRLAQTTESSICTLKSAAVNKSSVEMTVH